MTFSRSKESVNERCTPHNQFAQAYWRRREPAHLRRRPFNAIVPAARYAGFEVEQVCDEGFLIRARRGAIRSSASSHAKHYRPAARRRPGRPALRPVLD